jgi:hypothetical protein
MRYAGGGIGHAAASQTKISGEDDAMNIDDDDVFMTDADQATNAGAELVLEDSRLLDELQQIAIEEDGVDWDESEQLMDGCAGDGVDSDLEDEDDSDASSESIAGEIESDSDFGPEDGEDASHSDTGHGAL